MIWTYEYMTNSCFPVIAKDLCYNKNISYIQNPPTTNSLSNTHKTLYFLITK